MNEQIIGKCSRCGGTVVIPSNLIELYPPTARCVNCGANAKDDLPTVEME